mgnify:CR=1 FL=1
MSRTLHLAEQLIARRSVTPDDGGCQQVIRERLVPLGFGFEMCVAFGMFVDDTGTGNFACDAGTWTDF